MLIILSVLYTILFVIVLFGMIMQGVTVISLIFTRGVPFVSTPSKRVAIILAAAKIKPGQIFLDLGCGKGEFLIEASRDYGATAIGYEVSLWPYLWAKARIMISRSTATIKFASFLKADLSQADVIYCYLLRGMMAKLEKKFVAELKPGSRVFTYAFPLPNRQPNEIVKIKDERKVEGNLYIYFY
ncbi:MAG: methyltransferase domain-containing protein [Candidatus Paceibacterota bacterium]|jgi:hypothetical protein